MLFSDLLTSGCLLAIAAAQSVVLGGSSSSSATSSGSGSASRTSSSSGYSGVPIGSVTNLPSGTYLSLSSTITLTGVRSSIGNATRSSNATMTSTTSETPSLTVLGGTQSTVVPGTSSGSRTAAAPTPINTTPCNNYPELCNRRYSNITMVAAHNSPFAVPGNAASNQIYGTILQLDDGVRLLQTETHWPNSSAPYLCHSSCDILNVGSLESWLVNITAWVAAHPYDVVTLLIGNQAFKPVGDYVASFQNSGILKYVYTPPKIPMGLNDWPTLASLILTQQRVIVFMDYDADQTTVPYILDQFSQMWETPFNPTDNSFPCTVQRPPGLSDADAKNRLYLLNNNLNTEITLLGQSLLVPTTTLLNVTNAANGTGSLGASSQGCYDDWGRAPNFLDVDYYNVVQGSVFEVAAKWNNVTYNRPCCGVATSGAERTLQVIGRAWLSVAALAILTTWTLL